jgi:hypothetical protein
MKSDAIKKIIKYFSAFLALVFLFQAITHYSIIPLERALNFLGIGRGIFQIVKAILYLSLIVIGVGAVLSFLNRKKIVKGVTKNTILLNMIVKAFMAFIIFFPAWISFWVLGGFGLFGEEVKTGIEHGKALADLNQISFLNLYIFWYLLITTFVKPEIDPKFGITKDEEGGWI